MLHRKGQECFKQLDGVEAYESSLLEEELCDRLGCWPEVYKFSIWFRRAQYLGGIDRFEECYALCKKTQPLTRLINKHAEEDLMKLTV